MVVLRVGVFVVALLMGAFSKPLLSFYHSQNQSLTDVQPHANFYLEWPHTFEGKAIHPLGLSSREAGFVADFPGKIQRFSDGSREIIMRQILEPTRRLHPASNCLKSTGYRIEPLPLEKNAAGEDISCFIAEPQAFSKGRSQVIKVCEWITDHQGQHWSDVSSWYWSVLFSRDKQHWWSYAVAEVVDEK